MKKQAMGIWLIDAKTYYGEEGYPADEMGVEHDELRRHYHPKILRAEEGPGGQLRIEYGYQENEDLCNVTYRGNYLIDWGD